MKAPTLLENLTLVTALLVALPCTAIKAADVFPIATNPSVESAMSIRTLDLDGQRKMHGIGPDAPIARISGRWRDPANRICL